MRADATGLRVEIVNSLLITAFSSVLNEQIWHSEMAVHCFDMLSPVLNRRTATSHKFFQKGTGLQMRHIRMGLVIMLQPLQHSFQAHHAGVEHGPTSMPWKAITEQIDDVNILGSRSYAIFQDTEALVGQGEKASLNYFLI